MDLEIRRGNPITWNDPELVRRVQPTLARVAGSDDPGMMLAAELTLAGVDALILERRPDHELDGSRAGGLHARAIELLDQRGVAARFLAEGKPVQICRFGETEIDDATAMIDRAAAGVMGER